MTIVRFRPCQEMFKRRTTFPALSSRLSQANGTVVNVHQSSASLPPSWPCRKELRRPLCAAAGWQGHGTDLLNDSLAHNYGVPKVILHGHSETGFDVINMVKNLDPTDEQLKRTGGIVHMYGSILVLPGAAFLWKVRTPQELTVESIVPPLQLFRPRLEYLFIGSPAGAGTIDPTVLEEIRQALHQPPPKQLLSGGSSGGHVFRPNLVVEPMDLINAMGTFNILNGEDRRVGAALILPPSSDEDN